MPRGLSIAGLAIAPLKLIGAERKEEAEKIQEQALAVLDDPQLRSAVSDAEREVNRKLAQRTATTNAEE